MKYSHRLITLCALLVLAGQLARASIPPHPDLKARIAAGKLARPYYLEHQRELLSRGVNAPWAAPSLGLQKGLAPGAPARSLGPAQAPVGPFNALLILVDFSDNVQQVQATKFDTLVFNTSPGTVSDYFSAVSYGNLTIVTVDLPSQIGWTRVDSTYAYYVDGQNGFGDYPKNAQRLVEDVVTAVNGVVDFSLYDNDADNEVDALFIAHAGPGAEFTGNNTDIWSHAWVTYNPPILDGVSIWRYSMEPEFWASPGDMTIGVYAHEMGHSVFGLPDLYDTDDPAGPDASWGLGRWSLMAGGSWNGFLGDSPAHPDAWSHIQMGYVTPTILTANVAGQVISQIETNAQALRLWTAGAIGDEYFLVENRQQVGYDAALPGSGLLIYHVDEAVGADQNDNEWYPTYTDFGHYLVALEQADGLWQLEENINSGDAGDPFPGVTNNLSFNDATTPDSRSYAFGSTDIAILNISASANDMTVDVFISSFPDVALAPDTLDFGSVFVGHASTQILTVISRGTDSLRVSAIAVDQGAFSVDTSAFVLGPGDSLDVSVTLTAASAGVISATITVTSNDPDQPAATAGLNAAAAQPAEIALSPDSLSADLFPDDSTTQVLTVHNLGAGELAWSVAANEGQRPTAAASALPAEYYQDIPKGSLDTRVGPPVERGQGGPDVFGYTWIDSDEPGGPAFNWIDISGTGPNSGIYGDDAAWVNLGFPFSFYGRDYDQVLIGENGTLSFINYGESDWTNDPIPSTNTPNALIAVFWDDHHTLDGGAIYYETRGSEPSRTFIAQWHQVPRWSDINSVFTFQVILSEATGSIVFQYKTMTGIYGDGSFATVGIEDSLGVDGLKVSFNTAYVQDGLAIRLSATPPWLTVAPGSGTVAPGGSQDVVVTFNSTGLVPGILQGHLTFDSNDPGNASTFLPVSLRIPLIGPPLITGIADVPADQGGWVMASWLASPDDTPQSPHPVLFYSVWLYGPGATALPAVPVLAAAESSLPAGRSPLAGLWLSRDTDGVAGSAGAAPSSPGAARDDYPVFSGAQLGAPGWIGVGSIGATLDSVYTFLVPTWQDSNAAGAHWSRIRVSAHTSVDVAGFAFSAPDSGYSVDNIAPAVPAGLVAVPTELGVSLSWTYDTAAEADFQYFAVYRGTETGFTPVHPDSSIATTTDPAYADEQVDPGVTYFYRVAAVDYNGNVSDLSAEVAGLVLALADGLGIPDAYALRQNYPNPFNPSTTIRFELPEATPLTLAIFDILGREVVRLSAGTLEAGYHQVVWNGRTAVGREVTTGLYIVRLVSPAFTDQFKMVLMK